MPLQSFLNDLSAPEAECEVDEAVRRLRDLVATIRAAAGLGLQLVLNADHPLAMVHFGANWSLAMLRNRNDCREEGLYLATVADRSPLAVAMPDAPAVAGDTEYRLQAGAPVRAGAQALALGLAHETGGLGISLATHPCWEEPLVPLDRDTLEESGDVAADVVEARNACRPEHVATHAEALAPVQRDGAEVWAAHDRLFPHLRFAPRTRQQIEQLPHGDRTLAALVDRLAQLDRAIGEWRHSDTALPPYPFHVRPESKTRIRKGYVDFEDGKGAVRTFSDHVYFGRDAGRIHFILETEPERIALIGHVDRKLGIG